jgi:D-aminopeptidase
MLKDYPEKKEAKTKSIILIAATDAPLLPMQLGRLCKRMSLGLARTGSVSTHGSGDILLAFSTANRFTPSLDRIRMVDDRLVSWLWEATVEATEEAVLNALTTAPTMDGVGGRIRHSIPLDRLQKIMQQHGRSLR